MVDGLALPPAFEYLPALGLLDEEHARLRAELARVRVDGVLEFGDAGRTADETARYFVAAGATRVCVVDAHSDPAGARHLAAALRAHGLSVTRLHDTGEQVTTVGPVARLSRTPVDAGRAAPAPGADGIDVLQSVGLTSQLPTLEASGAFRREPLPVE